MHFLLVGNYGIGNLGDEALKDYFLRSYPGVHWTVVSAHPDTYEVARLPIGIRSFFAFRWLTTLSAFHQSRGVVFGGGTLFTDQESVRACILWGLHAYVAKLLHKPYFLAFQGIGPFRTKIGETIARSVVRHATFVSVRDPLSAKRIRLWKMNTKVVQTFDPVFRLMYDEKPNVSTQKIFIIIPRFSDGLHPEKYPVSGGAPTRILLLEPSNPRERRLADTIRAGKPHIEVVPIYTLTDLMANVAQAQEVLSARYHGALAAIALGKELRLIPQGEEDKLSALRHLPSSDELLAWVHTGQEALKTALTSGVLHGKKL